MFSSFTRTISLLARTPVVPAAATGPAIVELTTFPARSISTAAAAATTAGSSRPSRPRAASRTASNMSVKSGFNVYAMESRRYASDHGKKELYSDETGSVGAGIDDVAHTDAAYDKDADPHSAAKKVESETGKDFTKHSPARADYSQSPNKQGQPEGDVPLNTSKQNVK